LYRTDKLPAGRHFRRNEDFSRHPNITAALAHYIGIGTRSAEDDPWIPGFPGDPATFAVGPYSKTRSRPAELAATITQRVAAYFRGTNADLE